MLVPVFCHVFYFKKFLKENSSELEENLWELFLQQYEDVVRRASEEGTWGPGATPSREQEGGGTVRTRPWPWRLPYGRLFAYKIPLDLKRQRRPLFSMKISRSHRHLETLIREGSEDLPDILSEGRSSSEASSSAWLPHGDE